MIGSRRTSRVGGLGPEHGAPSRSSTLAKRGVGRQKSIQFRWAHRWIPEDHRRGRAVGLSSRRAFTKQPFVSPNRLQAQPINVWPTAHLDAALNVRGAIAGPPEGGRTFAALHLCHGVSLSNFPIDRTLRQRLNCREQAG